MIVPFGVKAMLAHRIRLDRAGAEYHDAARSGSREIDRKIRLAWRE